MRSLSMGLSLAVMLCMHGGAYADPPPKLSPAKVDKKAQAKIRAQAKQSLCPKGLSWLNGTWRFVGLSRVFQFRNVLSFKGSQYTEKLEGGPPHRREQGVLRGHYGCVDTKRILMRIDKAEPESLFGNRTGDDYPCDIRGPFKRSGAEQFILICYVEWDLRSFKGLDLEFERVAVPPITPGARTGSP